MDVKEYTLYQKWCEVHDKYPTQEVNSFFDDKPTLKNAEQGALLQEIKNNFWLHLSHLKKNQEKSGKFWRQILFQRFQSSCMGI